MITAFNNKNSSRYRDLFAKAAEVLSGYNRVQTFDKDETYYRYIDGNFKQVDNIDNVEKFANALTDYKKLYVKILDEKGNHKKVEGFDVKYGITTLEEYYNWLPEIKAIISKDKDGNPLKDDKGNIIQKPTIFTKLPLDEPYFEINPNTRAITIPSEFKKNGIAVQGDDLAEVVYFMIDRYFDAMDLNNTDIYIEWETPKSKNGGGVKSVSETYLKIIDDENYPGKLIFGWAISDAITKDSGTLKFAVRFIQRNDEKKVVYSFNTLTAQATIHPNLGLDLENDNYNVDNCNDRLLERIEPSVVVGGIQAATPRFLINIKSLEEGYDITPDHTTGTYDLNVVATSDDTGAISYVWKRAEIDSDSWQEVPSEIALVKLTEKEYIEYNWHLPEEHIYYYKLSDDTPI